MFYRTIRMMEHGIKPVFVFDGAPPELKKGELDKRLEKREEAEKQRDEAKEKGDLVSVDKFERRLVKVGKFFFNAQHIFLGYSRAESRMPQVTYPYGSACC